MCWFFPSGYFLREPFIEVGIARDVICKRLRYHRIIVGIITAI